MSTALLSRRWAALANLVSALCLLAFWLLFAALLPYRELSTTLLILVDDPDWTFVNALGVVGAVAGVFGFIGLHTWLPALDVSRQPVGFATGLLGLIMLTAQLLWETFVWPIVAIPAPEFFAFDGPLYTSVTFLTVVGTAGALFSFGYVLTGAALARRRGRLRWIGLLLAFGAPLFGLGALAGTAQVVVRTAGISLLALGLIGSAWALLDIRR